MAEKWTKILQKALAAQGRNSTGRARTSPGIRQEKAGLHAYRQLSTRCCVQGTRSWLARLPQRSKLRRQNKRKMKYTAKRWVQRNSTQHERRKRCRQQGRFGLAAKKLRILPKLFGDERRPKKAQVSTNQYLNQYLDKPFEILVDVRGRNPWNKNYQEVRRSRGHETTGGNQ